MGSVDLTSINVDDKKKLFEIPSTQTLIDLFSCETFNYRGKLYVFNDYLIFIPTGLKVQENVCLDYYF